MLSPRPRAQHDAPCTIDEAQARIIALAPPPVSEPVGLIDACGRIVAAPARATRAQPPFASAAMDGWAVAGCNAGLYRIVGESRAGCGFPHSLTRGEAVAISTGAPLPKGAARVVRRERAIERGRLVDIPAGERDADVRPRGGDFDIGAILAAPGVRIDALAVARLAAAGIMEVAAARRPTLTILATGDELAAPGSDPRPDQIWDSLSLPIQLRARATGADCRSCLHIGDAPGALEQLLDTIAPSDIVVIVGGASGGRHDHTREALAAHGVEPIVASVLIKPGKPFWTGRTAAGSVVIGLPGNPVAALACVELFLLPLIRAWQGAADVAPAITVPARHEEGPALLERVLFARLKQDAAGRAVAEPLGGHDSAALSPIMGADVLLRPARGLAIPL